MVKRKGHKTTKEPSAPDGGSVESEGFPEPAAVNPPLRFALKLEREHPYLAERGLSRAIVETFGLGVCPETSRSIMKARLCIPIHNPQGELVAYAGRWLGDEVPEDELRYKLPEGFRKSLVLYNLHRVAGAHHLVVVEGYFGLFRLHELGAPAVALMGHDCSDEQISLLQAAGVTHLTLLLDGDEPGRVAAEVLAPRLARSFFVHLAELPDDEQPDTAPDAAERAPRAAGVARLGPLPHSWAAAGPFFSITEKSTYNFICFYPHNFMVDSSSSAFAFSGQPYRRCVGHECPADDKRE